MMMFIALLIKTIYILKIHLKQNINILLTSMKISVLKNLMTQWLIWYSNDMEDAYKNSAENNPNRQCNVLIFVDDMIAIKN